MNNPLLATFENQPALLATGMETRFKSYLDRAAITIDAIESSSTPAVMQDDYWPAADNWLAAYRPYVVKGGILMIPVKGVLLNDFGYALGNWATGYTYIAKAMDRGLGDPDVKGIAFILDSGGGAVAGNFDLVDRIYGARGQKPIRAFASEHAYSAAYSIASAADSITVSRTGGVGSIGVVTAHFDASKAMDHAGYKITFIHFGKHKVDGNSYEPLPEEVRNRIQARIDTLGEVFVSTVARNRSMDEKAVRDTEALTFSADEAVSNGLADNIGSLDDAIVAFATDLSKMEDENMITQEQLDAAVATATATGNSEGAAAERTRINAIIGGEAGKKRPQAAMAAALDTDMSADVANAFLAKLPEEKVEATALVDPNAPKGEQGAAADFQEAMDKAEHPKVGALAPLTAEQLDDQSRAERRKKAAASAGRLKAVE